MRRGAMHYTPVEGLLARTTHDAQIRCDHPEFSVCVMRAAKLSEEATGQKRMS